MKILIAEDDDLHRTFLRSAVEKALPDCEHIAESGSGAEVIEATRENCFNQIIMDLQMPGINGVEAAKEIWRRHPDTRILFWSNYADEAYVRGVSRIVPPDAVYGYLLKSASEERLELGIRGVFVEEQCIIDREVMGVQHRSENNHDRLTDLEYEVLMDIALGMTDKAISIRREMSTRGVQSRLKHLYEKLGVGLDYDNSSVEPLFNSRTRAVVVALTGGLLNIDALESGEEQLKCWLENT